MNIRCLSDIRQCPLLVGAMQCMWSLIPLLDLPGSMFARQLHALGLGIVWGGIMACTGALLVAGALIARRETLTIALFLSALVWSAMTVTFVDASLSVAAPPLVTWMTPVTLTMPVVAVSLWFCLFREMIFRPVTFPESEVAGRG